MATAAVDSNFSVAEAPISNPVTARRLLGSLNNRLSLALIAIVVLVGIGVLYVSQIWMRVYYEELTQKLNSSIAMYVVREHKLMQGESAEPNIGAIQFLANQAMVINPVVEVYLLDTNGRVIAHPMPANELTELQLPLAPIKEFISGDASFPIRNTDPRHAGVDKIFSAAEIRSGEKLQGYLYVVLGGQAYDKIEDGLKTSYSRSMVFSVIFMIVIAAVVIGLLVFKLLVRRLSLLSIRIQDFSESSSRVGSQSNIGFERPTSFDEIEVLSQTFERMAATIDKQFDLLREVDETRRELISNVSHDLRTPLASIQGYLETLLIKNGDLTEAQRLEYLHTAMKGSKHLGQLIGDLFELSKLEANGVTPTLENFSLAELVYDIVQDFKLQFEAKNIQVTIHNNQFNALVFADISLIQRVFENLIRNAIAYTPENGAVELTIDALETGVHKRLKVTVADTGQGISDEDLPHIFDRFYNNPDKSRRDSDSTGLGLAIVKRILELHKSDIKVASQINHGAKFEFHLQAQAA